MIIDTPEGGYSQRLTRALGSGKGIKSYMIITFSDH